MEEKQHIARKKWVRRFAIVFFITLLLLTFFSNTIMNHSLARVSTQYIESDSVSAKVRGTGTIEAGEAKEISITESREVEEVLVKTGDKVNKDDVLIRLKEGVSSEVTAAEKELENLKEAYLNNILVNEIDQTIVNKAENGGDSYEANRSNLTALSNKVKAAQEKADGIQKQIDAINSAAENNTAPSTDDMNGDSSSSNPELDALNKSLKAAQEEVAAATKEHEDFLAGINKINDLKSQYNAIKTAETNLEKLKQKNIGNEIKAACDGEILTMDVKAGDTITPDTSIATIQNKDNGYSLSFSVTNDQAKKVKVGDEASVSNSWYYGDIKVKLSAIKNDPSMPGRQKLLVFSIEGEAETGTSMSVSLGDKSTTYDYVVPNSAVREDNNGKFILVVKQKSSPLGNRYAAKRIDVEVSASDDSKSAVTGAIEGGEYVITTSNKMVNAGDLVRLAE